MKKDNGANANDIRAMINTVLFDAIKKVRALEVNGNAFSRNEFVQGVNFGGRMLKFDVIDLLYDILDEVNGIGMKNEKN